MSNIDKKGLVPELRFPEFKKYSQWDLVPIKNGFKRITTKNTINNQNALTISAQKGLISQTEYFNKRIASKDLSGYYLLEKGDFAYNKSYSNGYPMGAIKLLKEYEKGVVSVLYICFRALESYNESFYEHYFEAGLLNSELNKIAQEGGRAHGLLNVSVKEFFSDIKILKPLPEEQLKIADCLTSIDDLITVHTKKFDTLKAYKKGLMQQFFPAEGETAPKLRFPEFVNSEDWVERIFGKILKINSGKGFKASEYTKSGTRLLQIENVGYGTIKWSKKTIFLPESYCSEYPELVLKSGDVILALNRPVTNGELKIAKISSNDEPSILYQRVGKFELLDLQMNFDFVFHVCREFIKSFVLGKSRGSDQPFIAVRDLYSQKILIPEPIEQQRIAKLLSSADNLISAQRNKIEYLKAHKKGLMQKLFPSAKEEEHHD
jgi:type I restriction enzyme S subunit